MNELIKRARDLGFEVNIPSHAKIPNGITQFDFIVPAMREECDELDKLIKTFVEDKAIRAHKQRLGCIVNQRYNRVSINMRGLGTLPRDWEEAAYKAVKEQTNEVTREDLFETVDDCLNRLNALLGRVARANLTKPLNGLKCAVDGINLAHLINAQQALGAALERVEFSGLEA